jgi:2-methylisocitrate lyase-like PEP mutase family enzyme
VRRLSVGGALARAAWGAFLQVAHQIAEDGTFSGFQNLPDVNARLRTLERRSDQPGTADKKV